VAGGARPVSASPRHAGTPEPPAVVARYGSNGAGRDFVVGDIHGMFAHLEALMRAVSFRQDTDRLFSVGDLVDRGPDSRDALEWLAYPWFHACRGNHEQFAIDSDDPEQREVWIRQNGGEWWLDLNDEQQDQFRRGFLHMPLAMEVETATGLVGIVHADVPPMLTWERFMSLLEAGNNDATFYAMWSRNRILGKMSTPAVQGCVDRVYCGHTPTRQTVTLDNVHYIDTGAVYSLEGYGDACLTMVEIHPARHREHTINTSEAA